MSKKVIAKNTFAQVIGRMASVAAGFIVAIVIARNYGVSGFGEFSIITAFVSLGYLLCDFGLNASYLKFDTKRKYFIDFLFVRLLLGLIAALLLIVPVLVSYAFGNELFGISKSYFPGLVVYSLTILTQAALVTYGSLFQMRKRYDLQTYSLLPGALVLLFLTLLIVISKLPLIWIYAAYVLSGVVSIAVAAYFSKEKLHVKKVDISFGKKLLQKGLPLGLLLIFNLLYFRIDTLILSSIRGASAVGIYGYAYKFFDFALTIPLFLSNALYPFLLQNQKIVRKGGINEAEYFAIFLFTGILAAVFGYLLSPIIAVLSPGFNDSVIVLQILCLSLPLFFVTSYVQWLLIAKDQEKGLLWVYVAVGIVNIFLNIVFIPKYSYIAAAVSTVICEGIVLMLLLYKLHLTKNLRNARSKGLSS